MREDIRLVDLIIEIVDARIPIASRNPDLSELGMGKARLIVLGKADLADAEYNKLWLASYKKEGHFAILVNAKKSVSTKEVVSAAMKACSAKLERDRSRGIRKRPLKAMVVGIPNVGKSTFINTLAGKDSARTGNKPGVTKGNQWIRLNPDIELLDTPGMLWPKFEDQEVGLHLAMIGSINENIIDTEELSYQIIDFMSQNYQEALAARYALTSSGDARQTLERIAENRRCLLKGGELDLSRAARMVADDFKNGRLGKMTIERP